MLWNLYISKRLFFDSPRVFPCPHGVTVAGTLSILRLALLDTWFFMLQSTQIYCTQVISICTKCENTSINWLQFLTISRGPNFKANSRELQADRRCFFSSDCRGSGRKASAALTYHPSHDKNKNLLESDRRFLIQCFTVSVLFIEIPIFRMNLWFWAQLWGLGN